MELSTEHRTTLRRALTVLDKEGPTDTSLGICWNLDQLVEQHGYFLDVYSFVSHTSVDWPDIDGEVHVVEGVRSCAHPIVRQYAGDTSVVRRRKPLWQGEQLRMRKSLIAYLISTLE